MIGVLTLVLRRTRKLYGQKLKGEKAKFIHRAEPLSSCISLGLGDWRRQETKIYIYVSITSESTYNPVSKVRESKTPAGSPASSLKLRFLKAARSEIEQIFRAGSISCLIVCHDWSFDFNSPH